MVRMIEDSKFRNTSVRSIKSISASKGTLTRNDSFCRKWSELEDSRGGLGCFFIDRLDENKDKIHQVDATLGQTETNGSVRERGIAVAIELQKVGVKENDVVLLCSRAHRDQTVVLLGSLLIGAIVAPLDSDAVLSEFKSFISTAKPKVVFCDARVCGQLELALDRATDSKTGHKSCTIVYFGKGADKISFERFMGNKPLNKQPATDYKCEIKDSRKKIAFIVPTQATTDQTKFTCISHGAVYTQIMYMEPALRNVDKFVSFFPLAWIAQVLLTCYCFVYPVTRILPGAFSERYVCKLIHDLRIDAALLGTDLATRTVAHSSFQDFDLSCLKLVYVGGISTTALEMVYLRKMFKAPVFQAYGMTEMSGFVSGFGIDDYQTALRKPASVGKPLPGIKVKIIHPDTKEVMKNDWWGELFISGPTLMLGYFKNISGTSAVKEKNYLKTGDIGQMDDEGYLYIEGRSTDYVQVDGHRFIPTSIEEMIISHPYVLEAVVVSGGKELVACVVKKVDQTLTADSLLEYLNERLPESKKPTKIKFVECFPKTAVGKVKRGVVKQMALEVIIEHSKSIVSMESQTELHKH